MKCQKDGSSGCAIKDDMQTLYPQLKEADVIVLASPIYWFNISAQTKNFIDRCYAVGVGERNIFKGKRFVLGLVGSGAGQVNLLNYCDYHLRNRYF